jgi:uncharacterized protein (TIGR02246 family)
VAAVGTGAALSFREALQRHLDAIQNRDLDALAGTLGEDALVEAHRAWFERPHWSLHATPVEVQESAGIGYAVLHLLYCEDAPGKPARRQQSHLTLVFEKQDGRWLMVLDQNIPIR